MNVLEWGASGSSCAQASITSPRAIQAAMGMPPAIALPTHMMSGSTPQWSTANHAPVRPNPVISSSTISRTSRRAHNSLSRGR